MEIPGTIQDVLRNKSSELYVVTARTMVFTAIKMMAEKNVGALLVMRGEELVGLISERDYTRKVILKGQSSKDTLVGMIMTREVVTVGEAGGVGEALRVMAERRVRHLPVMRDGRVVGMLSIGDLVKWVISAQDSTIRQLQGYITGGYPG